MSWSGLPAEIRILIWELAFPALPRTFTIATNKMKRGKNKIPVDLHVNYESRYLAKNKYKLLFDGTNLVGSENCQFLCFNPKVDTFFLSNYTDLVLWKIG
ncbi:predicted protein [Sclerotinia sclerotiorum 1980 UF-70]|uniref:2EXR domain-containing protein n=1 Tax=Sclerotinia sclerotiorum (strain ATCC 18683 / 1980 / Ss-1) TaxID=665079 RepID=A7F4V6_SCLS1|nr:predicted protein [Sclerotinia sclerotiorum 1980 UF-70]EDN97777.1 predicted protein [Sclerotinia sclerotiorum 1980 UF-70]